MNIELIEVAWWIAVTGYICFIGWRIGRYAKKRQELRKKLGM